MSQFLFLDKLQALTYVFNQLQRKFSDKNFGKYLYFQKIVNIIGTMSHYHRRLAFDRQTNVIFLLFYDSRTRRYKFVYLHKIIIEYSFEF